MGRDAVVTIWVGIECDHIPEFMPENELTNAYGDEMERLTVYKNFSIIRCCDDICGAGVIIFRHDWDYGVTEINLKELHQEAQRMIYPMKQIFKEWGVDLPVKVYTQTNFY